MIVTDVIEYNHSKYKIYIEQEFAFVLYKGELRKYKIKKDEEITEEAYTELTQKVMPKRAKLRCMNLLTKRPYTEERLRQKLRDGLYTEHYIDIAIAYVKSYGYVDDAAYAREYMNYHIKTESVQKMKQKLLQKGISKQILEDCIVQMEDLSREAEICQIRHLFQKKYQGVIPAEAAQRAKMMAFFMRRGYSQTRIKAAVSGFSLDELYN